MVFPFSSVGDPDPQFLDLPDPDPLVREVWIRILAFSHKDVERTEITLAK
jgi:hypothetical protein